MVVVPYFITAKKFRNCEKFVGCAMCDCSWNNHLLSFILANDSYLRDFRGFEK